MPDKTSRRSFLQLSAFAGIASVLHADTVFANEDKTAVIFDNKKSLVFLFQGDSITDGNRGRNKDPNHVMAHGYAFSIASRVGADFAEANHQFYNRGISGNRVADLKNRWPGDTLDISPDVLSVLIGINDVSALVSKPVVEDAVIDLFVTTYRDILEQSKHQHPDTLFVLCLPFVYAVSKVKDNWEKYSHTVERLTERVKKLAIEF